MTETLAVHPQILNYYNYNVICNYCFEEPEPVIQNTYTYEENGVYYCASATEKGVYWYSYARNCPLMYTDPDGEFIWIPIVIGAAFGIIQGAMIGHANGAKGGEWAGYILGGAAIGALSGLAGGAVAGAIGQAAFAGAGIIGASVGGAVGGAISGFGYGTMAAKGDIVVGLNGMWKGAVSGFAGGLIGSSIGGGVGAFFGGATSGAIGSALNGGSRDDIFRAALFGGFTSLGAFHLSQAMSYGMYKKDGGTWNYRQYYKASVATQRSLAWGREISGWITKDDIVGMTVGGNNGKVGMSTRPDDAVTSFHTHYRPNQGAIEWHSATDLKGNSHFDVDYVIGWKNAYQYDPSSHPLPSYYNTNQYSDLYLTTYVNPSLVTPYNNNFIRFPYYWFYFGH